jgi:hypothetical protein
LFLVLVVRFFEIEHLLIDFLRLRSLTSLPISVAEIQENQRIIWGFLTRSLEKRSASAGLFAAAASAASCCSEWVVGKASIAASQSFAQSASVSGDAA